MKPFGSFMCCVVLCVTCRVFTVVQYSTVQYSTYGTFLEDEKKTLSVKNSLYHINSSISYGVFYICLAIRISSLNKSERI